MGTSVADPVALPTMTTAQEQGWRALMDLHEDVGGGWTLVGGQLVHLWCAERGVDFARPTDDIDTVLDVRARPRRSGTSRRPCTREASCR